MQDCQYASCYYYDFCIYLNIRFISVEMTRIMFMCLKTEFCVALALFDYFIFFICYYLFSYFYSQVF